MYTMSQKSSDSTAPNALVDNSAGKNYWENVDGDVNGMLGGIPSLNGFSSVSRIDLQGSRTFLARLGIGTKSDRHSINHTLEGGAGIGRVTEGLLLRVCDNVDVIEPVEKFTQKLQKVPGVQNVFNTGLEGWQPIEGLKYDLIWIQWCVGYLTNDQLVSFLKLCQTALKPTGYIVVKENVVSSDKDLFDETDSSVTRQDSSFRTIFETAGLKLLKTEPQRGLPETSQQRLFPVQMYALRPMDVPAS